MDCNLENILTEDRKRFFGIEAKESKGSKEVSGDVVVETSLEVIVDTSMEVDKPESIEAGEPERKEPILTEPQAEEPKQKEPDPAPQPQPQQANEVIHLTNDTV